MYYTISFRYDLFLCTNGDYIYKYNEEFGWKSLTTSGKRQWRGIACDDIGVIIYACAWKDYIYYSEDLGDTWIPVAKSLSRRHWTAICCNGLGDIAVACATWSDLNATGDYVWISTDFGYTWDKASTTIRINKNGISFII